MADLDGLNEFAAPAQMICDCCGAVDDLPAGASVAGLPICDHCAEIAERVAQLRWPANDETLTKNLDALQLLAVEILACNLALENAAQDGDPARGAWIRKRKRGAQRKTENIRAEIAAMIHGGTI
jgi:hypothetical protein